MVEGMDEEEKAGEEVVDDIVRTEDGGTVGEAAATLGTRSDLIGLQ